MSETLTGQRAYHLELGRRSILHDDFLVAGPSGCNDLDVPVSMHCPRCKQPLDADDPEALADDMLVHLREAHGHEPPREHVLARIAQRNQDKGNR